MTRAGLLYLASFLAHGALAAGVVSLKSERGRGEDVAISVVESKKAAKPAPEAPPPPPAPPPEAAPVKAKAAPAPAPAPKVEAPTPAPAAAESGPAVPDFGLSLGGSTGGGGLAVAAPRAAAPVTSSTTERVAKKLLAAPTAKAEECPDPPKKPKVISITQPAYTSAARDAQIAGKVRIEVTVDATGKVASARVLEGLGHGLDEAALAAARGATFEPGLKCGKPASATFVIAIRFAL